MRLGKTKAVLIATLLLMGGVDVHAENIPAEEQRGYERWYIEDNYQEEEKKYIEIDVELSFYTSLIEENTSHGSVDAQGNPLEWGTIAVPRSIELGTKFDIEGYEGTTFVARDRGSKKHIRIKEDGTYRIDMFVPRKDGEDDDTYWERVNNYGKVKRKAKMYIEE